MDAKRKIAEADKKTNMKAAALLLIGTFLWATSPSAHANPSTKPLAVTVTVLASCCVSLPRVVADNSADVQARLEMEVSNLVRGCCAKATPFLTSVEAAYGKGKTGSNRDQIAGADLSKRRALHAFRLQSEGSCHRLEQVRPCDYQFLMAMLTTFNDHDSIFNAAAVARAPKRRECAL